jgi:hypothetical protein
MTVVWRWVCAGVVAFVIGVVGWWLARSHAKENENETAVNVLGFFAFAFGLLCVGSYFAARPRRGREPPIHPTDTMPLSSLEAPAKALGVTVKDLL